MVYQHNYFVVVVLPLFCQVNEQKTLQWLPIVKMESETKQRNVWFI